jgi:hypothetical protein
MSSIIKVDTIQDQDGNNIINENANTITIGKSGDTVTVAAGATFVGGGISWQSVQTTGFTAVKGNAYPCDTTSAGFTVTLPATPSAGDQVQLVDYAGTFDTNKLIIDGNGEDIEGAANNFQLTGEREGVILTYIDSTQGWIATSGINEGTDALEPESFSVDYLVVAGGGGGGGRRGGGGGAGGFLTSTSTGLTFATNYTVTVGAGGTGGLGDGVGSATGANGSNSVFSTITSTGGGGARGDGNGAGNNGGSGGGGSSGAGGSGNTPSTAPSQGNDGGSGSNSAPNYGGGGGGGASAVGVNGTTTTGGNGGAGTASSITGSSVTYAGGGGGGTFQGGTEGSGGTGGGGAGGAGGTDNPGYAGTVNTGGGGGGGSIQANSSGMDGGNGGSGIVILKYPDTLTISNPGGGLTSSTATASGFSVTSFTAGTGNIQFN